MVSQLVSSMVRTADSLASMESDTGMADTYKLSKYDYNKSHYSQISETEPISRNYNKGKFKRPNNRNKK